MRVVFLTHYFPPEVGAPQARIAALAAGLSQTGWSVTVHAPYPHYPHGAVFAPYRQRPWLWEERDGYRVLRSPVYPAANRGTAKRLAGHASFAASSLAAAALVKRADVVVVETPPLFLAGSAVPYARALRAALVTHIADRWPESAVALGALGPGPALRAAEWLERFAYRHAERVVSPTRGIAEAVERLPEAAGRVVHIPPAVDVARFPDPVAPTGSGPLRAVYAGTLGLAQRVETLAEAAGLAGDAVHVQIAGGGAGEPAVAAAAARAGNVELLGVLAADAIPALLGDADVGVVLLRDLALFDGALPTKLLEVMAAGRAVIYSGRGEGAELVQAAGAGVVVAPEDPAALSAALVELATDRERAAEMGRAGRAWVAAHHDRAGHVARWAEVLGDAAAQRAASA